MYLSRRGRGWPENGGPKRIKTEKSTAIKWRTRVHEGWEITTLFESKQRTELKRAGVVSSLIVNFKRKKAVTEKTCKASLWVYRSLHRRDVHVCIVWSRHNYNCSTGSIACSSASHKSRLGAHAESDMFHVASDDDSDVEDDGTQQALHQSLTLSPSSSTQPLNLQIVKSASWRLVVASCVCHLAGHSRLRLNVIDTALNLLFISNQIKSNLFNKRTTRPLSLQYKQYTVNTINWTN